MDNQRLILFAALAFTLLLMWQAWQADYGPKPPPVAQAATEQRPAAAATAAPGDTPKVLPGEATVPQQPAAEASTTPRVHVVTDLFDLEIDTKGGDLRHAALLQYPVAVDRPDAPFLLLGDTPDLFNVVQSGFTAAGNAPDHYALYHAAGNEFRLADGAAELRVPLTWSGADGVTVTKTYVFKRGSYDVTVEERVENRGGKEWRGRYYRQLQRTEPPKQAGNFVYTYTGGAIYSPAEKYEKVEFKHMADKPLARDIAGGWAAMMQHYFVVAWLPPADETAHYYSKALSGGRYALGLVSPERVVPAAGEALFTNSVYLGPKVQKSLAALAPGLDLTVDYGWVTVIAKPIFWLLQMFHKLLGNWGWAIILVTVVVKGAFYKLSEASYRSMAQMKKLTPRLQALKERYGDDRQKLNEKMMEIYKEEKINPLGGCLPIVVQIPVFIALYWVVLESVELRQAPFIFWIADLSIKDPYYVLPVLMGITMWLQQKLNPAPVDPIQQKVMMTMPIVFTVFFAFFPSGLVVYWVTNSGLSIAQQWVINKRIAGKAT